MVGTSQYCEVSVFLGAKEEKSTWGERKTKNKERMGEGGNIDQMACTLSSMFT